MREWIMAIPPIISNSPIFKIFQSDNAKSKTDKTESAAQSPQDVVEISEAAQQRLNNIQDFSAENQAEIREAAGEAGEILRRDESLTLGVDPAFDS